MPVSDLFCGVVPASAFTRFGTILRLEGAAGLALQRLAAEGLAWVPCLGNIFTLTAAAIGLALAGLLAAGAPEAIFMIAPVLLLLSQDPLLLPGLADRQRYFPPQVRHAHATHGFTPTRTPRMHAMHARQRTHACWPPLPPDCS